VFVGASDDDEIECADELDLFALFDGVDDEFNGNVEET